MIGGIRHRVSLNELVTIRAHEAQGVAHRIELNWPVVLIPNLGTLHIEQLVELAKVKVDGELGRQQLIGTHDLDMF